MYKLIIKSYNSCKAASSAECVPMLKDTRIIFVSISENLKFLYC